MMGTTPNAEHRVVKGRKYFIYAMATCQSQMLCVATVI